MHGVTVGQHRSLPHKSLGPISDIRRVRLTSGMSRAASLFMPRRLHSPCWAAVKTVLSHSLSTPASLLKSRSNVPRGRWPAFRATSKTKQSEKPNAGRLRKHATAAATASES